MTVALCTDATALLPAAVAERHGITIVPIALALDERPFEDPDGRVDEFYDRLAGGARASTSQPSPGRFAEAYAAVAAGGASDVLSIHLDARLSGTVASAEAAARDAPVRVTVVDTGTASFGVAICVRAAADALAQGASTAEAAREASIAGAAIRNLFVARASPGGRVPRDADWAVLELVDGAVEPLRLCDAVEGAVDAMTGLVGGERRCVRAAVGHAAASTASPAARLVAALDTLEHVEGVERYRVGPAVGAHTGPDTFGLFWWPVTSSR